MSIIPRAAPSSRVVNALRPALAAGRVGLARAWPGLLASLQYVRRMGRWPDLHNPRTFDEKLLWLELHDRDPLRTRCSDKLAMRAWVEAQGLGHLLPRLFATWEKASDVDLRDLPDRFVLKCTHGSGFNIVCRDRQQFDLTAARRTLARWLHTDYSDACGEIHYRGIEPKVLCEELLDDGQHDLPVEYKIFCFHGRVHCIAAGTNRILNVCADFDFYDRGWDRKLPYYGPGGRAIPRPAALEEMVAAAETLSQPFPFVRVDLYDIRGRAVLGELTFTPAACMDDQLTEVAQREMGALLRIPGGRIDR